MFYFMDAFVFLQNWGSKTRPCTGKARPDPALRRCVSNPYLAAELGTPHEDPVIKQSVKCDFHHGILAHTLQALKK